MTRSASAKAFSSTLRSRMLVGTALACAALGSSPTLAQLVTPGDLIDAIDNGGNPGFLTVTNPTASTATINVLAAQVVAEWSRFNVPDGTSRDYSRTVV